MSVCAVLSLVLSCDPFAQAQSPASGNSGNKTQATLQGSIVTITSANSPYTPAPSNRLILCDATTADLSIVLPTAGVNGQIFTFIVSNGLHNVTVSKQSSDQLVDPDHGTFMGGQSGCNGDAMDVISDTSHTWYVTSTRNGHCQNWINSGGVSSSGGSGTATNLDNGDFTGQTLYWEGATSKWEKSNNLLNLDGVSSEGEANVGVGFNPPGDLPQTRLDVKTQFAGVRGTTSSFNDYDAGVWGVATYGIKGQPTSQTTGVWGLAEDEGNPNGIAMIAEGNYNNLPPGDGSVGPNVALEIRAGELTMGRGTESGEDNTLIDADGFTSVIGPSGTVDVFTFAPQPMSISTEECTTCVSVNSITAGPSVNSTTVYVTNPYATPNSIILCNVLSNNGPCNKVGPPTNGNTNSPLSRNGASGSRDKNKPLGDPDAYIGDGEQVSCRVVRQSYNGQFQLVVTRSCDPVNGPGECSINGNLRVGYMIINPVRDETLSRGPVRAQTGSATTQSVGHPATALNAKVRAAKLAHLPQHNGGKK